MTKATFLHQVALDNLSQYDTWQRSYKQAVQSDAFDQPSMPALPDSATSVGRLVSLQKLAKVVIRY